MNPVILIFAFLGFCVSLNGAVSQPPKNDPLKGVHPKLRRTPTDPSPADLALAESFWESWLGPAVPPIIAQPSEVLSSNDTIDDVSAPNSTFILDLLTNSTELDLSQQTIESQVSESTNGAAGEESENSTVTSNNPDNDSDFSSIFESTALFNTEQEQQVFITQLYNALSKEILNITTQSLAEGSQQPSTLAAESAVKALASKLSPKDRALFENSIILSLAKPNPLPTKKGDGTEGNANSTVDSTVNSAAVESPNNSLTLANSTTVVSDSSTSTLPINSTVEMADNLTILSSTSFEDNSTVVTVEMADNSTISNTSSVEDKTISSKEETSVEVDTSSSDLEDNLKLLSPNVTAVLNGVDQIMSNEEEGNEESTDQEVENLPMETPEFNRIIKILKNLFKPVPATTVAGDLEMEGQIQEGGNNSSVEETQASSSGLAGSVETGSDDVQGAEEAGSGEVVTDLVEGQVTEGEEEAELTGGQVTEGTEPPQEEDSEETTVTPLSPKLFELLIEAAKIAATASTTSSPIEEETTTTTAPETESREMKLAQVKALLLKIILEKYSTTTPSPNTFSPLYVMK